MHRTGGCAGKRCLVVLPTPWFSLILTCDCRTLFSITWNLMHASWRRLAIGRGDGVNDAGGHGANRVCAFYPLSALLMWSALLCCPGSARTHVAGAPSPATRRGRTQPSNWRIARAASSGEAWLYVSLHLLRTRRPNLYLAHYLDVPGT